MSTTVECASLRILDKGEVTDWAEEGKSTEYFTEKVLIELFQRGMKSHDTEKDGKVL